MCRRRRRKTEPLERADVQRLRLQPDDALVIRVPGRVSADQAQRIKAQVEVFAPGHKVAVLEEGMELTVVSGHANLAPSDPGKPSA
jgi:hypothetical protein